MRVLVEVIAGRVLDDEVHYIVSTAECQSHSDPDVTVRAVLARLFPEVWLRSMLCHSTSWRFESDHIVLTYIGYSDNISIRDLPLILPLRRIQNLREGPSAVVAHAISHLAFLVRQNPAEYEKRIRAETISALAGVAPEPAGRLELRGAA
jgi:hypothetical protein